MRPFALAGIADSERGRVIGDWQNGKFSLLVAMTMSSSFSQNSLEASGRFPRHYTGGVEGLHWANDVSILCLGRSKLGQFQIALNAIARSVKLSTSRS